MAGFRATFYKDLKLMFKNAGLVSLILPFVLLFCIPFFSDTNSGVKSFPIAIRDRDKTFMSNIMISQMKEIKLFSNVYTVDEESNLDAFEKGAVAVVDIPKDYFYDAYAYRNTKIKVTLNDKYPLESTLFENIFIAVTDIMKTDQSVANSVYTFSYGNLDYNKRNDMLFDSGVRLMNHIMGRQNEFYTKSEPVNIKVAVLNQISVAIFTMYFLLSSYSANKSLLDEINLGILLRFKSISSNTLWFIISKYAVTAIFCLPAILTFLFIYANTKAVSMNDILKLIAVLFLAFTECFLITYMLTLILKNPKYVQKSSLAMAVISIFYGGTIVPFSKIPGSLSFLNYLNISQKLVAAFEHISVKGIELSFLSVLVPFAGIFVWTVLIILLQKINLPEIHFDKIFKFNFSFSCNFLNKKSVGTSIPKNILQRVFSLSLFKFFHLNGKVGILLIMCLSVFVGFLLKPSNAVSGIKIAIIDNDKTSSSKNLCTLIDKEPGISASVYDEKSAYKMLLSKRVEGVLIIQDGYSKSLEKEITSQDGKLAYTSNSSSFSAQALREILASKSIAQRSIFSSVSWVESLKKRSLNSDEQAKLREKVTRDLEDFRVLYEVEHSESAHKKEPFAPSIFGYWALYLMILSFSFAPHFFSKDARAIQFRISSLKHGAILGILSDCIALSFTLFSQALILIISGSSPSISNILLSILFCICIANLSLLFAKNSSDGKIDTLAPFSAIILALLGGSFTDFSSFAPFVKNLSLISPVGLYISGNMFSIFMLGFESIVFYLILKK